MAKEKRGFTVIEVVLVLMLAGLIFLMVFIALPQMQRSQRDTKRKTDMDIFVQAVQKYAGANRGNVPAYKNDIFNRTEMHKNTATGDSWQGFWNEYIEDDFADPKTGSYYLVVNKCSSSQTNDKNEKICNDQPSDFDSTIHFYKSASCSEDAAVLSQNSRKFAVVYRTESSGNYCFGN